MLQFLQVLGGIFLAILVLIFLVVILMSIGRVVRIWTERRYSNIWYELKHEGSYTVQKILWTDGGRLGLLLYFNEDNVSGHAIYSCSIANLRTLPQEGDRLKPRTDPYAIFPFEIIKESNSTIS